MDMPAPPRCWCCDCWLYRKKASKERTVATQSETEIFGGDAIAATPLSIELGAFFCEDFGQALHCICDQAVRLLYSLSWLIDKADLNRSPARVKVVRFFGREERCCCIVFVNIAFVRAGGGWFHSGIVHVRRKSGIAER